MPSATSDSGDICWECYSWGQDMLSSVTWQLSAQLDGWVAVDANVSNNTNNKDLDGDCNFVLDVEYEVCNDGIVKVRLKMLQIVIMQM